jgi:hypothetical protein
MTLKKTGIVAVILAMVVAALAMPPFSGSVTTEGAFVDAEYVFTFLNAAGKPLTGVELSVTDASGRQAYAYPVTNYRGRGSLRSDDNGVIRLQHVATRLYEFRGTRRRVFWFFYWQCGGAPQYSLKFYCGETMVHVEEYRELDKTVVSAYVDVDVPDIPKVGRAVEVIDEHGVPREVKTELIPFERTLTVTGVRD